MLAVSTNKQFSCGINLISICYGKNGLFKFLFCWNLNFQIQNKLPLESSQHRYTDLLIQCEIKANGYGITISRWYVVLIESGDEWEFRIVAWHWNQFI